MTIADFRPNSQGEYLTTTLKRVSGLADLDRKAGPTPVQLPAPADAAPARARATPSEFRTLADVARRSPAPMGQRRS
jgi:hypothetical protein